LSIYSNIIDGKIPFVKTAVLEIEFSGTENAPEISVAIIVDNNVIALIPLSTEVYKFEYNIIDSDEITEHEFCIELRGDPQGIMLHIHKIQIEGLDMRLTMEDSGTCVMNNIPHVPSEYMGQEGYQSLRFTTPIYPWLLANERKDTYYYPH
jgi:hypothetical protein